MIKLGVSVQGAQTAYVGTASGDRQEKAALMIQCAARGYLSRQELERLAENRKVVEEEQEQKLLDSLQIYRTFQSSVAPALASEVRLRRHSSLHQISAAAAGGGDAEQEEEEGESDDDDNENMPGSSTDMVVDGALACEVIELRIMQKPPHL